MLRKAITASRDNQQPYNPDLTSSDYFMLWNLNEYLRRHWLSSYSEFIEAISEKFEEQDKCLYFSGISSVFGELGEVHKT
jgi:hypothetical protein